MAIRNIVKIGDEVLRKKCRTQLNFDERLHTILDDMAETMYAAEGVGLAAPQVGILRRYCVIDVGDGLIELINPVIEEVSGEQIGDEGCLSVPGEYGKVKRPYTVTVHAQDRNGKNIKMTVEGFKARAFCHEIDHLDGTLYIDKVIKENIEG
ncbi:MAG: peptide deformylase [Clostridia bacterium]|nr:peptide deformylase [Clostridia bacterium]MEE1184927.1 peptide deformylase [Acutalibacteraceae bacterium]